MKTITISTVVSILSICGVVLPVLGVMMAPFAVNTMSTAMAGEIKEQVKQQLLPLNAGFKVLLGSTIQQLESEIAILQFKKETMPRSWTLADEQILLYKTQNLTTQRNALGAILDSEKQGAKK
jgi:hypothetical protein